MKTRLPMLFTLILLLGLLLSACGFRSINGSGKIVTESRPVSDFSAVNFSGFGELTLVQGDGEALTIETDNNLLPYLKTTVSQGTLTISFDDSLHLTFRPPMPTIHYQLTVKTLTALDLSGAGTIQAAQLSADRLTLTESGAGQITIDKLTVSDLTVVLSGAGKVELAGEATKQTIELSGLDNYAAGDLASKSANVTLSGLGAATVWVREQLVTDMSGAGSIGYYGLPQTSAASSGLGNLQSLGDK